MDSLVGKLRREWDLLTNEINDGVHNQSRNRRILNKKISTDEFDLTKNIALEDGHHSMMRSSYPLDSKSKLPDSSAPKFAHSKSVDVKKHVQPSLSSENPDLSKPKRSSKSQRHPLTRTDSDRITSNNLSEQLSMTHATVERSLNNRLEQRSSNIFDRANDENSSDNSRQPNDKEVFSRDPTDCASSRLANTQKTTIAPAKKKHEHLQTTQSLRTETIPPSVSRKPLRFIFIRHGERINQALGPDWFSKAFHTRKYHAYDKNLPLVLPKRNSHLCFQFDTPLTGRFTFEES